MNNYEIFTEKFYNKFINEMNKIHKRGCEKFTFFNKFFKNFPMFLVFLLTFIFYISFNINFIYYKCVLLIFRFSVDFMLILYIFNNYFLYCLFFIFFI